MNRHQAGGCVGHQEYSFILVADPAGGGDEQWINLFVIQLVLKKKRYKHLTAFNIIVIVTAEKSNVFLFLDPGSYIQEDTD